MTNLRTYACRIVETFPAFFLASLFFCVLLEYGPDKAKKDAAEAILEPLGLSAVILLFITCTAITGLTLLAFGSIGTQPSDKKRAVVRILVERPASFVADLIAPMFSVMCAVIFACLLFGYTSKVPSLLISLAYLVIFALLNVGLVSLTRASVLARIDKKVASGHLAGPFLTFSSIFLFFWVLPLKAG